MKSPKAGIFLLSTLILMVPASIQASRCVECHTDGEKLKAIASTLPQPEASAETAGKG